MKLSLEHLEARENPAGPVLLDPITGEPVNAPPPPPYLPPPPTVNPAPIPQPVWG